MINMNSFTFDLYTCFLNDKYKQIDIVFLDSIFSRNEVQLYLLCFRAVIVDEFGAVLCVLFLCISL